MRPTLVGGLPPAAPAWDAAAVARTRLEDEAATAVALLERFGELLGVALDAAGRGAGDELDDAVAERGWVVAELRPLLAALARARAEWPRSPAASAELARVLGPVDEALRHAGLLHTRITDESDRWAPIALVA